MEALRCPFATDSPFKLAMQVLCVLVTFPLSLPILCVWCLCCAGATDPAIGLESSGVVDRGQERDYSYDSFETSSESLTQ